MKTTTCFLVPRLATGTFTWKKRTYRASSFRGGPIEVYRVRRDGLEMFMGYLVDFDCHVDFKRLAFSALYPSRDHGLVSVA